MASTNPFALDYNQFIDAVSPFMLADQAQAPDEAEMSGAFWDNPTPQPTGNFKSVGPQNYWNGKDGPQLQLADGNTWSPWGANSGIQFTAKGEVYNPNGSLRVAEDDSSVSRAGLIENPNATARPHWDSAEAASWNPNSRFVASEDIWDVSGDLSGMYGNPDESRQHTSVRYRKEGDKLVPIAQKNWEYESDGVLKTIAKIGIAAAAIYFGGPLVMEALGAAGAPAAAGLTTAEAAAATAAIGAGELVPLVATNVGSWGGVASVTAGELAAGAGALGAGSAAMGAAETAAVSGGGAFLGEGAAAGATAGEVAAIGNTAQQSFRMGELASALTPAGAAAVSAQTGLTVAQIAQMAKTGISVAGLFSAGKAAGGSGVLSAASGMAGDGMKQWQADKVGIDAQAKQMAERGNGLYDTSQSMSKASLGMAGQMNDDYNTTLRPFMKQQADYTTRLGTQAYRDQKRGEAMADVEQQAGAQAAAAQRNQQRQGVNPSSGRALALGNQNAIQIAALKAGAGAKADRDAYADWSTGLTNMNNLGLSVQKQANSNSDLGMNWAKTGLAAGATGLGAAMDVAKLNTSNTSTLGSLADNAARTQSGITTGENRATADAWGNVIQGVTSDAGQKVVGKAWDWLTT